MNEPLKGFITYSHEDIEAKNELRKRLAVMEQQNELVTWDDGQLTPGDKALQEDILEKVTDSDLLLYLVSAASLASKNCNRELAEAIEGDKRVIPIILEHCDWLRHQLSGFEVLPAKGKPINDINEWNPESKGWQNVVEGIRKVVGKIQAEAGASSGTSEKELRAELAFQQGNLLMMFRELDEAIERYSYAINLNPRYATAYYNRGNVYYQRGELNNAFSDYDTAIKLNFHHAIVYYNRGVIYSKRGKIDNAINDYTRVIQLSPCYANAYYNRGLAYSEKGDFDKAINDYTKVINLNSEDAIAYYNRGNAYSKKARLNLRLKTIPRR